MPEVELTGEKIAIEVHQTNGDVTIAIASTEGTVALEPSVDILEAEVHDKQRKLRKPGKHTVDLTFSNLVTTTMPYLAMMGLATGSAPQVLGFSSAELYKVVVKVYKLASDASPDQTLTCFTCYAILEGIEYPGGSDFARARFRFIVNGNVELSN